jgi:SAM-dependent methyltransferase
VELETGRMTPGADRFAYVGAEFFAAAEQASIDLLPPDGTARVLELGCGKGATGALALRRRRCASWIGVEGNAALAGEALFALTDVRVGDVEAMELGYDEASFDLVIIGDAAGFRRPRLILARLAALLAPGGWLYLAATGDPLPAWLTPKSTSRMMRKAGLGAIGVTTSGRTGHGLFRAARYKGLQARGRRH